MTAGDRVALWEVLNNSTLGSRLDSLLDHLFFSGDALRNLILVLSCCLFLITALICFFGFSRPLNPREEHIRTRVALRALVAYLVPTCSLWPSRYVELASVIRSHIDLPLEVIIRDTIDGAIEFRNPSKDLADLIGSEAGVNGYTICINVGWKWWIKCFEWWILTKEVTTGQFKSRPSDWLPASMSTANSNPLDISLSPFALSSPTSCSQLCLDGLPLDTIPAINTPFKVTLEFTAFSPSLRLLSTARIICAIPFMISKRPRRRPRTLVSVLKQLNALRGLNIIIDSLSNISVDYECELCHMYQSFLREHKTRETWVKLLGIKAWRQEMFLVALEAALVRRGWLERWAIRVIVK